jgi:hypothetical protein
MVLVAKIIRVILLFVYTLLVLVHFIIKDHFDYIDFFFYVLPPPVLILGALPLIFLFARYKYVHVTLFTIIAILYIHWNTNYHFSNVSPVLDDSKSILLWNVAKRKDYNIDVLQETLAKQEVDAIFLVEAIHKNNAFNQDFRDHFKDYNLQFLNGNMIVIARNSIKNVLYEEKSGKYRLNHLQIAIDSTIYNIGLVDILNDLSKIPENLNKKEALNTLHRYAIAEDLDIILGDFNTPYESVNFRPFRKSHNSARSYQNGFTPTWPPRRPMFEIDQIWLSKKLDIIKLIKTFHKGSDHAMLISYFKG